MEKYNGQGVEGVDAGAGANADADAGANARGSSWRSRSGVCLVYKVDRAGRKRS